MKKLIVGCFIALMALFATSCSGEDAHNHEGHDHEHHDHDGHDHSEMEGETSEDEAEDEDMLEPEGGTDSTSAEQATGDSSQAG